MIELPLEVLKIIKKLNESGYHADVVGGAVRDLFIGRETNDYDITTDATPDRVKEIFSDERTIDTGIKHGTVTVLLDGVGYEVTTYRCDGEYKDSRHPESVTFTSSLKEDLARRDFTVNAMAYNPKDGLADPFSGREDIEEKIIRTVGDATLRFSEDALRIIRALRFSSVLGFSIEGSTRAAIKEKKELLLNVSEERIYSELYKLLSGRDAYSVISDFTDVINVILPEVDIYLLPFGDSHDPLVRMASIFALNCEFPYLQFDAAMKRLKTDNKSRRLYSDALKIYSNRSFSTREEALFILREFGKEAAERAIDIGEEVARYCSGERDVLEDALLSGIPYTVSGLDIGGEELLALGLSGVEIGKTLDKLLSLVISGMCENRKESLISMVTKT